MHTTYTVAMLSIVVIAVVLIWLGVRTRKRCPYCGSQDLLLLAWCCRECGKVLKHGNFAYLGRCDCGSRYMVPAMWQCQVCNKRFFDPELEADDATD